MNLEDPVLLEHSYVFFGDRLLGVQSLYGGEDRIKKIDCRQFKFQDFCQEFSPYVFEECRICFDLNPIEDVGIPLDGLVKEIEGSLTAAQSMNKS